MSSQGGFSEFPKLLVFDSRVKISYLGEVENDSKTI
jgi:hypothetical protein